jgi:hypothetical protein
MARCIDRHKERQTEIQTHRRTDGQIDIRTERHTDRRTVGQTNRETGRWRNLHAGIWPLKKGRGGRYPPPPISKMVKGTATTGCDLLRPLSVGISHLLQHMARGKVTWLLHVYAYVLQTYTYVHFVHYGRGMWGMLPPQSTYVACRLQQLKKQSHEINTFFSKFVKFNQFTFCVHNYTFAVVFWNMFCRLVLKWLNTIVCLLLGNRLLL